MSAFLTAFEATVRKHGLNVYAVTEYKDGVAETRQLIPANPCQDFYSVAKAFVVTAVGLLFDEGKLTTEMRLSEILRDDLPEHFDPRWERVTLDDLLLHRAGLSANFLDIDCFDARAFGDDYLAYTLKAPLARDPGTEPVYTDAAFYLLSLAVEKLSGERTDLYLSRRLFTPLGTREVAWSTCPHGHSMGATGLYLRTEDVAKLGEIYRLAGTFEGKRYLSAEWINTVLSRGYELRPMCDGKCFGKGGMRGQMLIVNPSAHRTVAWHSFETRDTSPLLALTADFNE